MIALLDNGQPDWSAISAALAAPLPVEDVEFKPGRGGSGPLIYLTARAVQDVLDQVVGAGNWSFIWEPFIMEALPGIKPDTKTPENLGTHLRTVRGTLSLHGVPKQDVGNASDIDPDKGAVSDALKRCAVMWGIGRYLYGLKVRDETEYRTQVLGETPTGRQAQQEARPALQGTPPKQEPPRRQPTQAAPAPDASPLLPRLVAALERQGNTLAQMHALRTRNNVTAWEDLPPSQQLQLVEHYEAKPPKSAAA